MFKTILAGSLALALPAQAAVFADSATTTDVSFFGSGTLIGAPDNGGAFLSNTSDPPSLLGSITFGFSGGLTDGIGDDLLFYDVGSSAAETYDVEVSADGTSFTFIGGFSSIANSVDIAGAFAGTFFFARVTNTSATNSPDLDAAEGFHPAMPVIPVPAALPLLVGGLGTLAFAGRRRRRDVA